MYLENLEPLAQFWYVLFGLAVLLASYHWLTGNRAREQKRLLDQREKRYWLQEMRWRASVWAREVLSGSRTLRLTDQRHSSQGTAKGSPIFRLFRARGSTRPSDPTGSLDCSEHARDLPQDRDGSNTETASR